MMRYNATVFYTEENNTRFFFGASVLPQSVSVSHPNSVAILYSTSAEFPDAESAIAFVVAWAKVMK